MNRRQANTLEAVFRDPVSSSIRWQDIESLLTAVGCQVIEGSGSRVKFAFGPLVAAFHRPHPAKEAKPYQVRDARLLLTKIGIVPTLRPSEHSESSDDSHEQRDEVQRPSGEDRDRRG